MTDWIDEILSRPRKTRAQDDGIFKHLCIFRIDPHAAFAVSNVNGNKDLTYHGRSLH